MDSMRSAIHYQVMTSQSVCARKRRKTGRLSRAERRRKSRFLFVCLDTMRLVSITISNQRFHCTVHLLQCSHFSVL